MSTGPRLELLSGNRLLAQGALDAGCRFFSGYPITPSSEIYETMMKDLPARNGLGLARQMKLRRWRSVSAHPCADTRP